MTVFPLLIPWKSTQLWQDLALICPTETRYLNLLTSEPYATTHNKRNKLYPLDNFLNVEVTRFRLYWETAVLHLTLVLGVHTGIRTMLVTNIFKHFCC